MNASEFWKEYWRNDCSFSAVRTTYELAQYIASSTAKPLRVSVFEDVPTAEIILIIRIRNSVQTAHNMENCNDRNDNTNDNTD